MNTILEFISVFQSQATMSLFNDCACYWFSIILHNRFPNSIIMYNPSEIHFTTKINGILYDINGIVEDTSDYISWDNYSSRALDTDMIERYCIRLERR